MIFSGYCVCIKVVGFKNEFHQVVELSLDSLVTLKVVMTYLQNTRIKCEA
jgi:hypothetical protein